MINKITYPETFYKNYTDACDYYGLKRDEIIERRDEVEAKYGSKRSVLTACLACGVVMTVCCALGIIGKFISNGPAGVGYIPLRNELFYILLTIAFLICWLIIRKMHEEKKGEVSTAVNELEEVMKQYGFHIMSDKDLTIRDDWEPFVYLGLLQKADVSEVDIKFALLEEVYLIDAVSDSLSASICFDEKAVRSIDDFDMTLIEKMLDTADFSVLDNLKLYPAQDIQI